LHINIKNPAKMSASINEKKFDPELNEQGVAHHETLDDKDLLQASYEAETRENEMGVLEAVKDHPMACFWAFVFCFTIVSWLVPEMTTAADRFRLWSPSICSSTVTSSP
jgi:hypothetical protein